MKSDTELERVIFDTGDVFFSQGDDSFDFYIIEKGEVDIYLPASDAIGEIHLATLGEGQPVGEFALVGRQPRSASARAKTPCTAIKISEDAYRKLLKELPSWCISVMEGLIERLRRTDDMLRDESIQKGLLLSRIKQIVG